MEHHFLKTLSESVNSFTCEFEKIAENEKELLVCRDQLIRNWNKVTEEGKLSARNNPLAHAAINLNSTFSDKQNEWSKSWDAQQTTKQLSETYEDRVVLLVFGKVNAGKSSLTNFIASTFEPSERRFFRFKDGEIETLEEPLQEGVIETTAQIQGVELGKSLVLLDSPGLYSVTDVNGELTRKFTDSADGVLWLTPSASPGQVQELKDLKRELEKSKPILPIITRSDLLEEDVDENDELIKVVRNKTAGDRHAQQQDVLLRTGKTLDDLVGSGASRLVREPMSISVHTFKDSPRSEQDFVNSGLHDLFVGIQSLIKEAMVYKPSKARQQVINYLDSEVLGGLKAEVQQPIEDYARTVEHEKEETKAEESRLASRLLEELAVLVPELANKAGDGGRDKQELIKAVNELVAEKIQESMADRVASYLNNARVSVAEACNVEIADFEDITYDYKEVTGSVWKGAAGAGGTLAGAAFGGLVGGPLGALIGGAVGGALGSKGGEYFVTVETRQGIIGTDATAVAASILEQLEVKIPAVVAESYQPIHDAISLSDGILAKYKVTITEFKDALSDLKQGV